VLALERRVLCIRGAQLLDASLAARAALACRCQRVLERGLALGPLLREREGPLLVIGEQARALRGAID
jgi:hypothetical protein